MASRSIASLESHPVRAWGRVVLIALALLLCLPGHGLWRLLRLRSPWPRLFLFLAGKAAGADVQVSGTAVTRDVLYIANHLSWLDVLVLAGHTGCAFVARADMAPWPLLGWMATINNSVYVQREKRMDVNAQAVAIRAALATRQPLTLFPEGTTGGGHALLPFRSSLIAAVVPPPRNITIQPVAIDYGRDASTIAWTDAESVGVNALRVMGRKGRIQTILHFLEPLPHSDFTDRKAMSAHSRAQIAQKLGIALG
jgi:1-acyl-sn-glycerol-3-phosphate acyltransferase